MLFIVFFFGKRGGQIFEFLVGEHKRGEGIFKVGGPTLDKTMITTIFRENITTFKILFDQQC